MSDRRVDEISIGELEQLISQRKAARARGEEITRDRGALRRRFVRVWSGRLLTLIELAMELKALPSTAISGGAFFKCTCCVKLPPASFFVAVTNTSMGFIVVSINR